MSVIVVRSGLPQFIRSQMVCFFSGNRVSESYVMLFARRHALVTALILYEAVALTNGQDYRYQTYGGSNYPASQSSYDRNLPLSHDRNSPQLSNPYNPQLNQYGQQNNYQNRPLYNQPGRPGTPSYRPNSYNYPVSSLRL